MHEQLILFGAPGTGKSYEVKQRLSTYGDEKKFRITIHPEYSYTDFVGQLLPDNSTGTTLFKFVPGPFTLALKEAYSDRAKDVFLILEELSRGNVSAIFGDIFQLLDRDEHFISRFPIRNNDISIIVDPTSTSDEIVLPSNFNIICTVNMNDQNVFPMDTAFKRRFEWEYVSTLPAVDAAGNVRSTLNNPKITVAVNNTRSSDLVTNWHSFYTAMNDFITDKANGLGKKEDRQVGQFFLDFGDAVTIDSYSTTQLTADAAKKHIDSKLRNKLLIYLWQDVEGYGITRNGKKLFDVSINSYGDLYSKFGNEKVFSDDFLNDFLIPNLNRYTY